MPLSKPGSSTGSPIHTRWLAWRRVGIELGADREPKRPFPRSAKAAERVIAVAREAGLLLYPSTGCADGTDGDLVMLGPPFVITDAELGEAVDKSREAVASLLAH